jgi:hypothetical protein
MIWASPLPYFTASELACRCCHTIALNTQFAAALVALRSSWGQSLNPTSVCRCPTHNVSVGGHPNSLHMTTGVHGISGTAAADFAWRHWGDTLKREFAQLAYSMGFSVGLHDGFCHVDGRTLGGLSQGSFVYGNWTGFSPMEVVVPLSRRVV